MTADILHTHPLDFLAKGVFTDATRTRWEPDLEAERAAPFW